jgi:hypothetical protein
VAKPSRTHSFTALVNHTAQAPPARQAASARAAPTEKLKPGDAVRLPVVRREVTEKYGRVFPSLEGLAYLAMCCKQSVVTAIADLEALGFVTRMRRIQPITTPLGFITRQITNAYRVHEPAGGLGRASRARCLLLSPIVGLQAEQNFIQRARATILR